MKIATGNLGIGLTSQTNVNNAKTMGIFQGDVYNKATNDNTMESLKYLSRASKTADSLSFIRPINLSGNAQKDNAFISGFAGDGTANINCGYHKSFNLTSFGGYFDKGFTSFDVRDEKEIFRVSGNHAGDRFVSMNYLKNNEGKVSSGNGMAGKRNYSLSFNDAGNNVNYITGPYNEAFGQGGFVSINIYKNSPDRLVILGTVGMQSVSQTIYFNEKNPPSKDFKEQLEIGALQLLL